MVVNHLDNHTSKDNYFLKLSSLRAGTVKSPVLKKKFELMNPENNNPDVLPRIKWGNLDDGTLLHCGNTVGPEIQFGGIENHILVGKTADSVVVSIDPKEYKTVTSVNEDYVLVSCCSYSPRNLPIEEKCREVHEVASVDAREKILDSKIPDSSDGATSCSGSQEYVKPKEDNTCKLSTEKVPLAACGDSGTNRLPSVTQEEGLSKGPQVLAVDENCTAVESSQGFELPVSDKLEPSVSGESTLEPCSEDPKALNNDANLKDTSKSDMVGNASREGTFESKERFRERLWCFLFENLNRSIDELYLLCELECDLEQMKEAVLVLEEAGSDFKELKSRVEEFEKTKRSSSQVNDGQQLTMKSDHRRPHALTWEVRRMTTSPRRAEILSSSLEAFRKMQQERERIGTSAANILISESHEFDHCETRDILEYNEKYDILSDLEGSKTKPRKPSGVSDLSHENLGTDKRIVDSVKSGVSSRLPHKETSAASITTKSKKDKIVTESLVKSVDQSKRQVSLIEREKDRRNGTSWRSLDAWKEKRNWEEILSTPHKLSSRFSSSPGMNRKSAERARTLHDKLMSPDKKKKTALDLKKEAEEKHARAMRIRSELENERAQKLQRTSEKLNRVNEWQAVRSMKLREVMYARHQRSESRHEAFIAQVIRRAGDESSKVNEVRFITSLNEENKKLMLRQKLHDSELRRAEKLQVLKTKQKEDMAREEAVLERKKLIEAEKLQRLAETQRKKEEAQLRREEERKASSAAREAKAMEQMRRKKIRAKAQQEEAELMAQKLAERLRESEQRRKFYLEQIRERASMDFRDQSSPLTRRSLNKDGPNRTTSTSDGEDYRSIGSSVPGGADFATENVTLQHSLKRRIKRIRQKLMALKYDFAEPTFAAETVSIGYRTAVATARGKIGRWLQELQKLRQARKAGVVSFGLITSEMIKFLEGRDAELQASRQAGLLDFIASALPASHISKPEASQLTVHLLKLLRVVLLAPSNRSYFVAQNLLPPIIPMLAASLENYIKIAASSNVPGSTDLVSSKMSSENVDLISEILDSFLWIVAAIVGHASSDEHELQLQGGLLELVVAYQVIHRLRDLFTLYDRPQVEGSPFPSSILLSIKLLTVLTSRFRNLSLIDSVPDASIGNPAFVSEKVKLSEVSESICSSCNSSGNKLLVLPSLNGGKSLPDVPEDRPLGDSSKDERNDGSLSTAQYSDKVDSVNPHMEIVDASCESSTNLVNSKHNDPVARKDGKYSIISNEVQNDGNEIATNQPVAFLLSAVADTGLVCLPSMLTAVLLQGNNRSSSEQAAHVLPSNFEEVAIGVLKVLNNLALINLAFIQRVLAKPDLKMEFFHLMSFLLSHCSSKWGVATDQTGLLLQECLSLLGYFALFHPENQAVLRWGKSPTILHKVCDLPLAFFSDPELMPVLAGTLVAACFRCDQNKSVIQQEISTDMLLSLLKACRNVYPATLPNNCPSYEPQVEIPQRPLRGNIRNTRLPSQKGSSPAYIRSAKTRNQRDNKVGKLCEETGQKNNQHAYEASASLMLHSRFSSRFIDEAEQFFCTQIADFSEDI